MRCKRTLEQDRQERTMHTRATASPHQIGAVSARRRWSLLGLSILAQVASAIFTYGAAFLIPTLQQRGLSLSRAGLVVAMPTVGLVLTLIAWGTLLDRIGERRVLVYGSALLGAAGSAAALVSANTVALAAALVVGGIGAASTNGAGGRLIVGWFDARQRGLAMGI
ncbi:MAG: MFS transporter, partial [Mycobacteriaceae bacterium]|nr:MFS transporter [Mycobacteriaceae bacterium]